MKRAAVLLFLVFLSASAAAQKAVFVVGVVGIKESQGQRISKDRGCFLEGHPMLGQIARSLGLVPLELHRAILEQAASRGKKTQRGRSG